MNTWPTMRAMACRLALATLGIAALWPVARAQDTEDTKKALQLQDARAVMITRSGQKRHYDETFDLTGLPHYVPQQKVSGTLKIWGSNYIETAMLSRYWREGFAKFHPDLKIEYYLPTAAVAYPALYFGLADLIIGHRPGFYDSLGYQRLHNRDPIEIVAATGSYDVPGWENSTVIVVNEANPLAKISFKQLDGVFGGPRDGGWIGTNYHPEFKRGPEGNIRTWGQLGLTGEWADKPIRAHGFTLRYNTATEFADLILQGSDKWNENLHTYGNYARPDGSMYLEADQIAEAVAADPYSIAYLRFRGDRPKLKRIAVSVKEAGPFVPHTLKTVQDRSWPLANQTYFYVDVKPGAAMDPKAREFLRYVLSQEGQNEVQRDAKYLPLTATIVADQLAKLK